MSILSYSGLLFADDRKGKGAIVVEQPKQYSYRYLQDQLRTLNAQLNTLSTLNAETVKAAQGTFQGSSTRQSSFNLSIAEIGLPKVETVVDKEADSTTKETTTEEAVNPTAPSSPTITAPASPISSFGLSAQDLLEEQVRLRYQISNLRLLLDQAVSDKFIVQSTGSGDVRGRLQVLLGFRVSIIPTDVHKDHAAVVEVTVKAADGKQAPSVMALMPEEKNYNATAMTQKRNAFGAAALAGVFSVGVSGSRGSDIFYIYQDTDTFAFERADKSAARFGWQFRPVLNQRTVQPGPRYLFVALALDDVSDTDEQSALTVEIDTHWQKYDRKRRVTKNATRYSESGRQKTLSVLTEAKLQEELTPEVTSATAISLDADTVNVRIEGVDIYEGSKVLIGGKYLADSAVNHRSENYLEFFAPAKELLGQEVRIVSPRYGFSSLVSEPTKSPPLSGFEFYYDMGEIIGDQLIINLFLTNPSDPTSYPDLNDRDVFVTLGDDIQPVREWVRGQNTDGKKTLSRRFLVNARDWLTKPHPLNIEVPFLGSGYQQLNESLPLMTISSVALLDEAKDGTVQWAVFGSGFDAKNVPRVYAGKKLDVSVFSNTELRVKGPKDELSKQKSVVVIMPTFNLPLTVSAPGKSEPAEKPKPTAQPQSARQNSSAPVEFVGTNLTSITKIVFEGKEVAFSATTTKLTVFPILKVTKRLGQQSLLAYYKENTFIPLILNVTATGD